MKELNLFKKRLKIVRGEGVYLWDDRGRRYLDLIAGMGVAILGHRHREYVSELSMQMEKLMVAGQSFQHEEKEELLDELSRFTRFEYVFISNSGTESVEASLKFARLYTGRSEIIAMVNGFHGRTYGSLSATWKPRFREGFGPLLPGFRHIPFNDVEAAKDAITRRTAAVILEPIQGESGIIPADREFIRAVRDLTIDKGALLICDEVQTGLRTGRFLAIEHYGVEPDIVTMGKGIGNGYPIGLTLLNFDVPRGKHGSTFGGNPMACKAAAVTLRILRRDGLIEKASRRMVRVEGDRVVACRGMGLMIGIVLREKVWKYVYSLQDRGILVGSAGSRVIRLLPPLVIQDGELKHGVDMINEVVNQA